MKNPWFCGHSDLTAPDGTGRAICGQCGALVSTGQLTLRTLQMAADQALYGVSFEDAWGNRIDPRDIHAGPAD